MILSLSWAAATAVLTLVNAQVSEVDQYQRLGNDMGAFLKNIGTLQQDSTADSRKLYSAAAATEQAVAAFRQELNNLDFSHLTPEQAKHQQDSIVSYLNNIAIAHQQLLAQARNAAASEAYNSPAAANYQQGQQLQQAPPQGQVYQIATAAPVLKNKAVVRDESSASSITDAPSSTETSTSTQSSLDSKESKSESKASKSALKSESKEAKSESKAASSASKEGAASNTTASATHVAAASGNSTSTATSTHHKHKNLAVTNDLSAGVIIAGAVLALL